MPKTFKSILHYLQGGFCEGEESKDTLKLYLVYIFSIIGIAFTFILGLSNLSGPNSMLSIFLFFGTFILTLNFIYILNTDDHNLSSNIILYFFFALMVYLIYGGGASNTGPLWSYSLPAMALFLQGFRKGLVLTGLFLLIISVMFLYPNDALLAADYSDEFKLRMILTLLLITFLSSVYEYSNQKLFDHMKKLSEDLEFTSTQDQLTSLYNRRGYHKNIETMRNTQGVILMCDIDEFKKINDVYGHYAGDFTIQEIAKSIQSTVREDDIVVRWGGEEFFVFLAEVTIDDAYVIAEKLRKSIESLDIMHDDALIKVTVSIGLAEINDENYLEDAIGKADNAMYLSKSLGRNLTSIHPLPHL